MADKITSYDFLKEESEKLLGMVEKGTAPFQKTWKNENPIDAPYNLTTGIPYRGFNNYYLDHEKYVDARWMTYKQAKANGWHVKKGERGSRIIRYIESQKKDKKTGKVENKFGVRSYVVFNASQIEGIPRPSPSQPVEIREVVDNALKSLGVKLVFSEHNTNCAYDPKSKEIHMLPPKNFRSAKDFCSVMLHELGHAISSQFREVNGKKGTPEYAQEEVRAELTSYLIARRLGLDHSPQNNAAYISSWIEAAKGDINFVSRTIRDASDQVAWAVQPERRNVLEAQYHRNDAEWIEKKVHASPEVLVEAVKDRANLGLLKTLIDGGAIVDRQDVEGKTALMHASGQGNTFTIKFLIDNGANLQMKDTEGRTAGDHASNKFAKEALEEVRTQQQSMAYSR